MTKTNNEINVAIAEELVKISQSFVAISEYLKVAGMDVPTITEVAKETKAPKKAKEEVEEAVNEEVEVERNVIEVDGEEVNLDGMTIPQLKKLAKEYDIEVPTKGKDKIISAILEALAEMDEEEEEEADVEENEEVDAEDTEEEDADEEEDEDGVDLDEMSKDELLSFIEENLEGEDAPKKKKTEKVSAYEQRLRDFILEKLDELDGEEEEEEADEEETEEMSTVIETEDGDIDLAEMNVKELKAFAKDYDLEVTAKKKDDIIEELLEQLHGEDEEDAEEEDVDTEEEEDLADEYGLNDMMIEELAELLEEHGLSTKGKKQALIDRVLKAIEDGTIELEEEGE